ncbi:hypothetical protein TCE0_017f04034 [Talaromyces pinophilus]|uniref:Uncharacterized protein n=1 Tax=Talaromyces pinophilus TaxID=128442 RepID=A0A6V8H4C9_TALPI|nr:hypothetical protein TCE0_017f04034 [Talaromyces pinophilus]
MVEHAFFNSDWIDKVITFAASDPFPAKQWKIVRQLNEIHVQGDEKESQALESLSHEDKAKEALLEAEISEERAMLALTKGGCESVPQLLNWKREKQDNNSGPVPGGYLVYLVLQNLPGVRLSCEDYWNFSGTQREEIREAFKVAYMCVCPIDQELI